MDAYKTLNYDSDAHNKATREKQVVSGDIRRLPQVSQVRVLPPYMLIRAL